MNGDDPHQGGTTVRFARAKSLTKERLVAKIACVGYMRGRSVWLKAV